MKQCTIISLIAGYIYFFEMDSMQNLCSKQNEFQRNRDMEDDERKNQEEMEE